MSIFASKDLARLQRIAMEFPMRPVLERYCQEQGVSIDEARVHERELKRYFVLTARHPDRPYGMKGPADELWHTFLLFTEMYRAFSDALMGPKRFLHHHPCATAKGASFPITYDGFWYDYQEAFGESPPVSVWPAPSGPRRSWDVIMTEVREQRRSARLPMAPRFSGDNRAGFGLAMLCGYGWIWGVPGPGRWISQAASDSNDRADTDRTAGGATGCGGGDYGGGGCGGGGGGCGGG